MKFFKVYLLMFAFMLVSGCYNSNELELRDMKNPDQATIRYNLYSNVYSEDITLQPISIGDAIVNVPRDYFYSTIRVKDDRSFFSKQFGNTPRNHWPKVSPTEHLMLLMTCVEGVCSSYPSTCNDDKVKCARALRGWAQPDYLNLVKIDFLFYKQRDRFYSLVNPRFIWQEKELIETFEGGYGRYTGLGYAGNQYVGKNNTNGGVYLPANKDDDFFKIQCPNNDANCEYLFYLPLDEKFAKKVYGEKNEKILVRAEFKKMDENEYDFDKVNEKVSAIREELCEFFPCGIKNR